MRFYSNFLLTVVIILFYGCDNTTGVELKIEEFTISTYSVSNFDGYDTKMVWTPTVTLTKGQKFTITSVKTDGTKYSPDGWGNQGSSVLGYELGTLVGSIENTENNFKVGSNYVGESTIDGVLYLVVDVHVFDNQNDKNGEIIVTIEY